MDKGQIETNHIINCVGERLKFAMRKRRLLQSQLSDATGITQAVISHYIKGIRMPILKNLVKIADVLNVSTDYLLGRTDSLEEENDDC